MIVGMNDKVFLQCKERKRIEESATRRMHVKVIDRQMDRYRYKCRYRYSNADDCMHE